MIAGFGKQSIVIGSAPSCDIVLTGPGVAPEHAHITNQGGGQLVFNDLGVAPSFAGGQPLAPRSATAFDLRTSFACGQVPVPLNHPAIALMLMQQGALTPPPPAGQLVIGREPSKASLVIRHPSVSSRHAIVALDRMMVVDENSTSGTYTAAGRIPPGQPAPLDPRGHVAFGPVAVPVGLLMQVGQAMGVAAAAAGPSMVMPAAAPGPSMAMPAAQASQSMPAGAAPPPNGSAPKKHRTVIGSVTTQSKAIQTIGRTPGNDLVVAHPQVSSRHAILIREGSQFFIEDCGSANGTYVRGQRLTPKQRVPVQAGERIYIGPMPLVIHMPEEGGGQVVIPDVSQWAGRPLYEIEAWDLFLQVPDRDNPGEQKVLLDHVSFKALPGDMIALMGPSGAGKTTLLMALNGYLPPTAGIVRINGENLYAIYDNLRGSIGYVPQDDIVHPELTVAEAVRYSARFRLPPDYSDEEIDARVDATLKALGLEQQKNLQIGKPEKKVLSGGQRKRVNIALELVTDPVILFLDEPTSGLAADDTTALINVLHNLAKSTGKTIIMTIHQPAKDEFEKFNLCLIMGYGGVPMFYGPTCPDAYKFFGGFLERQGKPEPIDNPRDMFDVLNKREQPLHEQMLAQNPSTPRHLARHAAAKQWNTEFFNNANPTFQKMFSGPRAVGTEGGQTYIPPGAPRTSGQFGLLFSRYFKIKIRDVAGTAILVLQAPIIGLLLALVFGGQKTAIPYWCLGALQNLSQKAGSTGTSDLLSGMIPTRDNSAAAFFLVVVSVWFGTSNAAREIVSERAVYLRERMVNLKLFNYVFSKYLLLSFLCILQNFILLSIVFFTLGFNGGIVAFALDLANLVCVSMVSVSLGLLLSTIVTSSEAAMSLTPIALIPQVVLGGLMVPMTSNSLLRWPMFLMPARWGFQGVVAQERLAIADQKAWIMDLHRPDLSSPADFVEAGKFKCATAQIASDSIYGAWGFTDYDSIWMPFLMMGAMTFVSMALLLIILKRRDPV